MLTNEEKVAIIKEKGADKEHILAILLELQAKSGQNYIDEPTASLVAKELGMTETKLYDIVTFYDMLSDKPQGRYVLGICNNTPCYINKADEIAAILERLLDIKMGETTADGMFSLRYTPCVGHCDIGPVISVADEVYGNLTEQKIISLLADLKAKA